AKPASLFKDRSRHGCSHASTLPLRRNFDIIDACCPSSKKQRQCSHSLSTPPGKVVTQGLISSQPKADVKLFSRFIPLIVLQIAMEGTPERHSLLVHDPIDCQIWRWRERGSDGREIYCHPNAHTQTFPTMRQEELLQIGRATVSIQKPQVGNVALPKARSHFVDHLINMRLREL